MDGQRVSFTFVDLFAGAGGLALGFKQEGFRLLFANDNNKWCAETYIHNNPNDEFLYEDVRSLNENRLQRIVGSQETDVLIAGVPCQSFSMSGYRIRRNMNHLEDSRHFMFREFVRIAAILSPKIVVMENVKGILSSHNGEIKRVILDSLSSLGFHTDCCVLNAADFGIPQLRERAIFLGNRLGIQNRFPKPTTRNNYTTIDEVLNNIEGPNHHPRNLEGVVLKRVRMIKPGANWRSLPKELQTRSCHSGAYGRLDPNKPARTLMTRFDTPSVGYVTHPYEDRTLTVREGARIQGFPDEYEFLGPKLEQYKQVGNAVPIGLSRVLAKEIHAMLEEVQSSVIQSAFMV